jgi:hypothetical protein
MKKSICSAVFLLSLILTSSIASGQSRETRDVRGFTSVGFGISGELYIKIGPEFNLVMEGDRDVLEDIETIVRDGKLIIRKENWRLSFNNEKVTINLTMPELEGVGVSGSGKVEILDKIVADDLDFGVSGSGKLIASALDVDRFVCGISGSGDVILGSAGSIDRGEISISGSGGFSGEGIEIDDLEVHISGSGNCRCRAGDNLEAYISGSGNITYSGNPKVDAKVSGSGHVRSK